MKNTPVNNTQSSLSTDIRDLVSLILSILARRKGAAAGGSLAVVLAVLGFNGVNGPNESLRDISQGTAVKIELLSLGIDHIKSDIKEIKRMIKGQSKRIDAILLD